MTVLHMAARRPVRVSVRRPAVAALAPAGVFLVCLLWRSPGLFLAPRIWAEEGHLYLTPMRHLSVLKGLLLVVNGNYQLLTNAIVQAARWVPARDFAEVTTYLSLLVSLGACWMVGRMVLARGMPLEVAIMTAALMAFMPAGYEVYLNATNVQWMCSLVALLVCLSEEVPAVSRGAVLRYGVLAVCGLTGLPSCILAPVFLAGAVKRRTRFGWAMVAVIAAMSLVQVMVVLAHRGDVVRPFNVTPMVAVPLVLHAAFAAFLPVALVDSIGVALDFPALQAEVVIGGVAVLGLIAWGAWESLGAALVVGLLGAAVVASLVNEVGALDPVAGMMSGLAGGRYFFLAGCCVAILLAAGLASRDRTKVVLAGVMVSMALLNGLMEARYGAWTVGFLSGPSHAEQVDACVVGAPCTVREWPLYGDLWVTVGGEKGSP